MQYDYHLLQGHICIHKQNRTQAKKRTTHETGQIRTWGVISSMPKIIGPIILNTLYIFEKITHLFEKYLMHIIAWCGGLHD